MTTGYRLCRARQQRYVAIHRLRQRLVKVVSRWYPCLILSVQTVNVSPSADGFAPVKNYVNNLPFEFVRWRVTGRTSFIGIKNRPSSGWLIQQKDFAADPRIIACTDNHPRVTIQLEE